MPRTVKLPPKLKCLRCGHEWHPRRTTVRRCPGCGSPYWDTPREKQFEEGEGNDGQ